MYSDLTAVQDAELNREMEAAEAEVAEAADQKGRSTDSRSARHEAALEIKTLLDSKVGGRVVLGTRCADQFLAGSTFAGTSRHSYYGPCGVFRC